MMPPVELYAGGRSMDEETLLSTRVGALRQRRGWTIAETARRAGLSVSMLWKVEHGQTTLTYGKLAKLALGLEVPIGELFANPAAPARKGGRRVVERAGCGPTVDVRDNLHRFLATDLSQKHCFPCIIEVGAKGDGSDSEAHGGEEFALVLAGQVRFHCEGYEPVVLDLGDSVYFDAALMHRYLQASPSPARLLCIYSHPEHARAEPSGVQPHSLAMQALGDRRVPASQSPKQAVAGAGRKPRRAAG
jgi:transcriptional regulator with XRE-family HTH domain